MKINHTASQRFLKYVQIDTQSDPNSPTQPSTEKQKNLAKVLVEELLEMGIKDAHLDEYGYVYATLPSNSTKKVPVICYCSHMDTSPDCSGKDVHPIVHSNYQGQDIVLPKDTTQILKVSEHPDLVNQVGNDIITADGTTLLGADNKAGVAEIMDAIHHLITHPEIKHGTIRILFTPDEEIGRGVNKVDIKKLAADFGYTVDGESLGHLEDETFSADGVVLTLNGISTHPGFAKNKMENAIKIASAIVNALPRTSDSPETTEQKEGFIHPTSIEGLLEKVIIKFIIRSFSNEGLSELENKLKNIVENVMKQYPKSSYNFVVEQQYRNMKLVLDKFPHVTAFAMEAMKRSGLNPIQSSIRGGTDGSRLSFMGLPCPNIFAGEHAFHSKLEWVSVQDMNKAVETLVNLAMIWEENTN
ncbi:MAG: peptidase T [Bacteroidetes bacterium]|nr:peptidase T [Bacteroidota bacterium]MBK9800862.1 peptidase T [Bacteroidota bacterium]